MLKNKVFLFSKPLGWRTLSFSVCRMLRNVNSNFKIIKNLEALDINSKVNDDQPKGKQINEETNCLNILKMFSFETSECIRMINMYPKLLHIPADELKNTLDTWLGCRINLENICEAFSKQPSLLDVEANEIKRRVPHLKILFQVNESVLDLLILNPNIMFDDWDDVQNKINFLIKEKCIRNEKLLKSCALTKPLNFIKLRFEIAEKCGKFIPNTKKPHKRVKFDKTNNVGLVAIVDEPDKTFSSKMGITLEEYRVYKDLFELNEDDEEDDEE